MTPGPRPWPRWGRVGAVALLALLLGGCVYLRLYELKRQLGQFDRYFTLQTADGLALLCREPILTPGDVRWIGLLPEQTKTLGSAEQWQVRWLKQLPVGVVEPGQFDLVVELGFSGGHLNHVAIPERYFAALPKEFLIGVIRSLGRGKVDKSAKKIETTVAAAEIAAARPTLSAIDRVLGRPSDESTEGETTVLRYRYLPATKESKAGIFDLQLVFDTASGELLRWHAKTPVGAIGFSVEPAKK